jgi:hypothetical protein
MQREAEKSDQSLKFEEELRNEHVMVAGCGYQGYDTIL